MRRHGEPIYLAIKAATRRLIERAGGVEAAASLTRVNKSILSAYCNPDTDAFMPHDVALDLESAVGEPILTQTAAGHLGYALMPVVAREVMAAASVVEQGAKLAAEVGDFIRLALESSKDHHLSRTERRRLIEQLGALADLANKSIMPLADDQFDARRNGPVAVEKARA